MAVDAAVIQYRKEYIKGFEQEKSLLLNTVTTEAVIKGNQATFLVADSGDASAVTRGVNGMIPARNDTNAQNTATLVEKHDLVRKSGFNVFASQGDQRRIMQQTTYAVMNREIDQDILTALATTTVDTSATASTASLDMVMHACAILGNNSVPRDGNRCALITPAFEAYLMQTPEFASADYINDKPFTKDVSMFRWKGVNFIVHENLSGVGTSNETCYFYHKNSIGFAMNTGGMSQYVGYDEEQDYSYARTSIYMGAVLLQSEGCVKVPHDGSGYASV